MLTELEKLDPKNKEGDGTKNDGKGCPGKYEESLRTFEKLHKEMHKERTIKMNAGENAIIGDENNEAAKNRIQYEVRPERR